MPRFLRSSSLLAVLFGAGCALIAVLPVRAQETASLPRDRNEVALSTRSEASLQMPGRDSFAALIQEIGFDDLLARKESATGERQFRVDWAKVNHQSIGLSEDEWNTAYSILLDGSERIDAWSDQMHEALGWSDGRFNVDPSKRTQQLARVDWLSRQGDPIVIDTMVRLRRALGDDGFIRLASFVDQREGGERIVNQGPIHRGPIQTAKASPRPGIPSQK